MGPNYLLSTVPLRMTVLDGVAGLGVIFRRDQHFEILIRRRCFQAAAQNSEIQPVERPSSSASFPRGCTQTMYVLPWRVVSDCGLGHMLHLHRHFRIAVAVRGTC